MPRERISFMTGLFMFGTACIVDLLGGLVSLIPIIGSVYGFFWFGVFWLWFMFLGVKFFSGAKALQRLTAMGGGFIIDALPVLGALPGISVSTGFTILSVWNEDREARTKYMAQQAAKAKREKAEAEARKRIPPVANDNSQEEEREAA